MCSFLGFSSRRFSKPYATAVVVDDLDAGQLKYTGAVNQAFLQAGGSVAEYIRNFAILRGWFEIDPSGARIILLQAGADL